MRKGDFSIFSPETSNLQTHENARGESDRIMRLFLAANSRHCLKACYRIQGRSNASPNLPIRALIRNEWMDDRARDYVHGYSTRERDRLVDQATTLTELLHSDTQYPAGCSILEAGCGVGAQTVTLVSNSPEAHFTSIDISEKSLRAARARVEASGYKNVEFRIGNIFNLPFADESFDHIFLCFVLDSEGELYYINDSLMLNLVHYEFKKEAMKKSDLTEALSKDTELPIRKA